MLDFADQARGFLSQGIKDHEKTVVREALKLNEQATDTQLFVALVQAVSQLSANAIHVAVAGWQDPREGEEVSRVLILAPSYLSRLTIGAAERRLDLDRFDDPRTLLGVLRAGTLVQRRAAARRLATLLEEPNKVSSDELQLVNDTLSQLRDVEISHDLVAIRARLSGVENRRVRAIRREWERLASEVENEVNAFWNGVRPDEPIAAMHADQRAHLFSHVLDLSTPLINHITAMIEGADGASNSAGRAALVASLRHANDPRLLPSLRSLLDGKDVNLLIPAIQALGHIDDPRIHPALMGVYERETSVDRRVTIAGALAMVGDNRGLGEVRQALAAGQESVLGIALEAMANLGTPEDCQTIYPILDHPDPLVVTTAVRTLGRIGDGLTLKPLLRLRQKVRRSALRAEIEEAETAIHARMELLGEEPSAPQEASEAFDTGKMAVLVVQRFPTKVAFTAYWSLFIGYTWLFFGSLNKAIARFELASSQRPGWAKPLVALAMTHARGEQYAQALGAFRRVLDIDRATVEKHPARVQTLARTFFRRADMVERQGRLDIACGLLDEVLAVDLRKAPSGLRFAITQRREELRARQK